MADRTCSVNGCPRPLRSSGAEWCNTHYFRVRRTGSAGAAEIWDRTPKPCSIEGCERTSADGGLGWCSVHYQRNKAHGDPTLVLPPRTGEAHPGWTGDSASYFTMHDRVKRARGRAADLACARNCGQQAKHWAYDHEDPDERPSPMGPFSLNVDHYSPLCVPCHKRFDFDHLKATDRR